MSAQVLLVGKERGWGNLPSWVARRTVALLVIAKQIKWTNTGRGRVKNIQYTHKPYQLGCRISLAESGQQLTASKAWQ